VSDTTKSPDTDAEAPVPATAAACGLFCEACTVYIASHEDPERLALLAARLGLSVDDAYCDGCRADRRMVHCRACIFRTCAEGRGFGFCNECSDFPCRQLQEFQLERPHRLELYEDLDRLGEVGVEAWMAEVREHCTCPSCGALNSAYDLKCRKCGHEPASAYVAAHRETIVAFLSRL